MVKDRIFPIIIRPWFHFFDELLGTIENVQKASPSQQWEVLERVIQHFKVFDWKRVQPQGLQKQRVNITFASYFDLNCEVNGGFSEFGDVPLDPLFGSLSTKNLCKLISSVLLERRIILTSSSLVKISASCLALSSLLYPLHWQNIFIPNLPPHLLHYCCAPMPFIVGIHQSSLIELESMPLEEVIL